MENADLAFKTLTQDTISTGKNDKIVNNFFFSACFIIVITMFVSDMLFCARLATTGIEQREPRSFYSYCPMPGTSPVADAKGALGSDFSQVYFSARALRQGQSAYEPKNPEFKNPTERRPNYPPLTNWLYVALTSLPYHQALLVHNYGTLAFFFALASGIMYLLGVQRHIWKTLLLFILLYFYTPIGFAHFERGQFDLLVTSSYLLAFSCIFNKKLTGVTGAAAGFLGAMKWSSLPFLGTFGLLAFAASDTRRRLAFLLMACVVAASILFFLPGIREYWPSLKIYEVSAPPTGASLMQLMPKPAAKLFQISCTLGLGTLFWLLTSGKNRMEKFQEISFPFAVAMAIQGMCFGTMSYEYRAVSFLGLIPAFVIWAETVEAVSDRMKTITADFFVVFLIVSFRAFDLEQYLSQLMFVITGRIDWQDIIITLVYVMSSIAFLILCVYIIIRNSLYLQGVREK